MNPGSLAKRSSADVVLALALVCHMAVSSSMLLDAIAAPLLAARRDVFENHMAEAIERVIGTRLRIMLRRPVPDSTGVLYQVRRA